MMNQDPNPIQPVPLREDRISLLRLEKHLLHELSPQDRARLEAESTGNPRLAASLAEMQETQSTLDWQGLRRRLEARVPASLAGPAPSSFILELGKRLRAWLPAPIGPKFAWAGSLAVLMLLIPAVLLPLKGKGDYGIRAKGGLQAEVVLEIGASRLGPGQKQNVLDGDILGFSYRCSTPLYTQVWYREDRGEPKLFDGRSDSDLFWPASSGWSTAPQRIRLEGDWKVQRVFILASPARIPSKDARRIILGETKPGKRESLFTYDLARP